MLIVKEHYRLFTGFSSIGGISDAMLLTSNGYLSSVKMYIPNIDDNDSGGVTTSTQIPSISPPRPPGLQSTANKSSSNP